MKVICLKDGLAFTRRHSVVSVHEKTRIARAEVTHVSIRNRAKSFFHVIWQFTVVVFLPKLQNETLEEITSTARSSSLNSYVRA